MKALFDIVFRLVLHVRRTPECVVRTFTDYMMKLTMKTKTTTTNMTVMSCCCCC